MLRVAEPARASECGCVSRRGCSCWRCWLVAALTTAFEPAIAEALLQRLFGWGRRAARAHRAAAFNFGLMRPRYGYGQRYEPGYDDGGWQEDYGTYRTLCVRTCDGFYFPIGDGVRRERLYQRRARLHAALRRRGAPVLLSDQRRQRGDDGRHGGAPVRGAAERVPLSQDAGRGLHVQAGAVVGGGGGAPPGLRRRGARAAGCRTAERRPAAIAGAGRRLTAAPARRGSEALSAARERRPAADAVGRRRPPVLVTPAAYKRRHQPPSRSWIVGELAAAQGKRLLDHVGPAAGLGLGGEQHEARRRETARERKAPMRPSTRATSSGLAYLKRASVTCGLKGRAVGRQAGGARGALVGARQRLELRASSRRRPRSSAARCRRRRRARQAAARRRRRRDAGEAVGELARPAPCRCRRRSAASGAGSRARSTCRRGSGMRRRDELLAHARRGSRCR